MEINKRIDELLGQLKPITLEQMSSIRLMNRTGFEHRTMT